MGSRSLESVVRNHRITLEFELNGKKREVTFRLCFAAGSHEGRLVKGVKFEAVAGCPFPTDVNITTKSYRVFGPWDDAILPKYEKCFLEVGGQTWFDLFTVLLVDLAEDKDAHRFINSYAGGVLYCANEDMAQNLPMGRCVLVKRSGAPA
ncbi:hypothetical protein KBB27_02960 [Patescibacteria group bacterium]|nr:hypothetical protein [Patescibacteria group bacterium]